MSSMGLTILVKQANIHSKRASEAIEAGQLEDAQAEMAKLSDEYQTYCEALADESPEQQQDDAEDNKRHEEKGCIPDSPHDGFVPGS